MRILSGDIGGTSTRLALVEASGRRLELLVEEDFPSQDYSGLEEIARRFLDSHGVTCDRACFGIAGPVRKGRSQTTNLPWVVDSRSLSSALGVELVSLLNDLEAYAYGISALAADDFVLLAEGDPEASGNAALIAAGTGLGEAGLLWDDETHRPFATEGGHADFAPGDDLEFRLFESLRARYGHVSWERVLSGPGLVNIYRFLRQERAGVEPAWLTEEMKASDPAAAISGAALAGRCEVCSEALDRFIRFYGAEAGNLALKFLATGGVYIGGGIAPKIVERLRQPTFMDAFRSKGRMRPLLEAMPVWVILNDRTALLGASRFAARFADGREP